MGSDTGMDSGEWTGTGEMDSGTGTVVPVCVWTEWSRGCMDDGTAESVAPWGA